MERGGGGGVKWAHRRPQVYQLLLSWDIDVKNMVALWKDPSQLRSQEALPHFLRVLREDSRLAPADTSVVFHMSI